MSSVTESHWQTLRCILLALLLAVGLRYVVIGSSQVEAQLDLRVDYRGLPRGLVVRDGMIHRLSVRLRGSSELLRGLYSRDLSYTVDLSGVKKGVNVLPLHVDELLALRSYEVVEVSPSRLVLEVDTLSERVLPLDVTMTPLPEDAPLRLTSVLLEPSFVTVKGPESQVRTLEHLSVAFDPTQDMSEGTRAASVVITGPEQVEITPPVTTLRYTLALKTSKLKLSRAVQLDDEDSARYELAPGAVELVVEVPEGRLHDAAYQEAIRVVVRPPSGAGGAESGAGAAVPVLVMLPAGARLASVEPSMVTVSLKTPAAPAADQGDRGRVDSSARLPLSPRSGPRH
ncbi:MAG: hypothetical protein J1E80_09325 [Desulfovibrionaceae bacterium]|nr:hypothetical protein [Desulfovibrionaceae bacterium]